MMDKTITIPNYIKISHIFLAIICGYILLYFGSDILITFCISLFLSFLLFPISNFLQCKGFPAWLAILLSIALAFSLIFLTIGFFTYNIISFQEDLPELQKTFLLKYRQLQRYIEQTYHLSRRQQAIWVNGKINEFTRDASTYLMNALSTTSTVLANLALIPIYIFFLTLYKEKIIDFIYAIVNTRHKRRVLFTITKVCRVSQQYLKGLFIDVLILSVLNSVGFLLLGLKHALLFGVLAAFLNIIPYVGVLVGSIFPILLAFLTKDSLWYPFGVGMVCFVVQFLDNNFITPKVVGSSVSINPLAAVLALLVGAKVWGIVGMVLAIPVTGMLKVFCDQVASLKPFGFLLGEEKSVAQKTTFKKAAHV